MRSGENKKYAKIMQQYAILCEKYAIFLVYGRDFEKNCGSDSKKKSSI